MSNIHHCTRTASKGILLCARGSPEEVAQVHSLCKQQVVFFLVKLLRVLDVSVRLEQFIYSLLYNTHVGHHVELSDTLSTQ
jgi:hypothetical protein